MAEMKSTDAHTAKRKRKDCHSSEIALAQPVIDGYVQKGWHPHQEVAIEMPDTGAKRTIDLVFTKVDKILAVELKLTLCPKVITQANRLRNLAHLVYIAVKHPGRMPSREHWLLVKTVKQHRLGLLYVKRDGELKSAEFHNQPVRAVFNQYAQHHAIALGLSRGRFIPKQAGMPSPPSAAMQERDDRDKPIRDYIAANPGCGLKELKSEFGWSQTQFNAFKRRAERGSIRGVRVEPHSVPMRLFSSEEEPA